MDNAELNVRVTLRGRDLAVVKGMLKRRRSPLRYWAGRILPTAGFAYLAWTNLVSLHRPIAGALAIALAIAWFVASGLPIGAMIAWRSAASVRTNGVPAPFELVGSEDGLTVSRAVGPETIVWGAVKTTVRLRRYLLIELPRFQGELIVPAHAFPSRAQFEAFCDEVDHRRAAARPVANAEQEWPAADVTFVQSASDYGAVFGRYAGLTNAAGAAWARLVLAFVTAFFVVAMYPWWLNATRAAFGAVFAILTLWLLTPPRLSGRVYGLIRQRTRTARGPTSVWLTDGALVTSRGGLRQAWSWDRLGRVDVENSVAIIFVGANEALAVPAQAFASSGKFDAFVADVRSRLGPAQAAEPQLAPW